MCLDLILKLFRKPVVIPPLALPHPEEQPNPTATVATVDVPYTIHKWLFDYAVPEDSWEFWQKSIDIRIYDKYPTGPGDFAVTDPDIKTPAFSWGSGGVRYIACLAPWLNSGVIAHEQAHNSYSMLSVDLTLQWVIDYKAILAVNPLVQLVQTLHPYFNTSDIEAHAEIYRYLGEQMPPALKIYYPRLF